MSAALAARLSEPSESSEQPKVPSKIPAPFSLRTRLEERVEMNARTARLHPDLPVRLLAEARAKAYRTALGDLDEAVLARRETVEHLASAILPVIYKNLLGSKPVI